MKYLCILLALCTAAFSREKVHSTDSIYGSAIPKQDITPTAGPRVDHGIDAFITADFIYWTARMDDLAYVTTGYSNQTASVGSGNTKYPDWKWRPGFKVGIGLNLPHDGWDGLAELTWLHSSADNVTKLEGNGILPLWNISALSGFFSNNDTIREANTSWDLHYYHVNLELGRHFYISRFLTIRPFVGLKGAWIDQDYHVQYDISIPDLASTFRMKNDQDYWGIGLRFGMNTTWKMDQHWGLYGNLSLSALWSQFQVKREDKRFDTLNNLANPTPLNTEITTLNAQDDFHTIKGVLELGIGLQGQWWFADNRYHILTQAGWDELLWINHNNLLKPYFSQSARGDMILQGLTIKLRFDF